MIEKDFNLSTEPQNHLKDNGKEETMCTAYAPQRDAQATYNRKNQPAYFPRTVATLLQIAKAY